MIIIIIIIILVLFIIILESKKKVEKKRYRQWRQPPKVSITEVRYKRFGGKPTPPPLFDTISYTAYSLLYYISKPPMASHSLHDLYYI
jgi:hypothetical protein